VGEIRKHYS
ncbi:hypothetical protein BV089_00197B, partial [Haemophilus influenzae]